MKKQISRTLLVMFVITVVLGGVKALQIAMAIAEHANFQSPPEAVTTIRASSAQWREVFGTVGSFVSMRGATLSAKESGTIVAVRFDSGAKVKAGDILIEIDSSVETANLKGALARLEFAKQTLERVQRLKGQSAMSLSNLEDAESRVSQVESEVQSIKAAIERKTVVAPFDGRAGIRTVNVASFATAGSPLVPLYSSDPIYFNFSVSQQLAPMLSTRDTVVISVDAFPGRSFSGAITAINPNIDEVTRTINVQATVANPQEELLPGMFGSVSLEYGAAKETLTLPSSGVTYATYGNSVYIVEHKKDAEGNDTSTVRQQIVELGSARGDLVAVLKGVQEGEEVVSSGAFKLRPGSSVSIQEKGAPPASLNPSVNNS